MPISHTVWSLDAKKPLEAANLNDEKELELLLRDDIEILSKDWLVISNQVKTKPGKFIDILCMDHDGDMVVVELKKDLTPREVTAQVIDYAASVSKMTTTEISQMYHSFTKSDETLNDVFLKKFKAELDESSVNQKVKMVIVAAKMDDGTERIIRFLRDTYQVDINILFFHIYQCGGERLISRAWFEEDLEETAPTEIANKGPWNGEYYVSFGEDEGQRRWDDARKYGFISAGGGTWYTKTLNLLSPGDRVWVNIPHTGYVGVGVVTDTVLQAKDVFFDYENVSTPMKDLPLRGKYFYSEDDPENAEHVVKIQWIKTVAASKAVKEIGFFGNQNSVCRPTAEKWSFTVERLKKCWEISD